MIFPPSYSNRYNSQTGQDELLSYPTWAKEFQSEGSFKRFRAMPSPQEVYEYGLLGLPNVFPVLGHQITLETATDALESAISEIELGTGMNLSPVIHNHAADYITGLFGENVSGISLFRWPATKILKVSLKYPFASPNPIQEYIYPSNWIYLRKNKMNIIPTAGTIFSSSQGSGLGGYSYFTGLGGNYAPGLIEVVYQAGFDHDQMPSAVADLIKTWAAYRFLTDVGPFLFPYSSVNVQIDAVSQSVGINMQTAIAARMLALDAKRNQLLSAIQNGFKSPISKTFIGV